LYYINLENHATQNTTIQKKKYMRSYIYIYIYNIRLSLYFNIRSLMWTLLECGLIKFYESYYNIK